ncbi:hypothetical protein EKK58_01300 [Candidatus Dependentiae bacterium]|nr:MAG: hypothetical protein EKK58_01300 [Candidatus Dependentiae bacterium]
MHTRLPSHTFVNEALFGQTNWDLPGNNLPTVFYQGSTIRLDVVLSGEGKPLNLAEVDLLFVLKKSTAASNVLYRTEITERVPDKPEGYFRVVIPAVVTKRLSPGVYYFAFQATQKATGGIYPPFTGTFSLELSAASPNPDLSITDGEPTADGPLGSPDEIVTPAETTGPNTPDIGKRF